MLDAFRYLLYTSYYAGIMLDAFRYLLCSKLCWHNRPEPSFYRTLKALIIIQVPAGTENSKGACSYNNYGLFIGAC